MYLFLSKYQNVPIIVYTFPVTQQNSIRIVILQQTDLIALRHQYRECGISQVSYTAHRQCVSHCFYGCTDIHFSGNHNTKHPGCQCGQNICFHATSQSIGKHQNRRIPIMNHSIVITADFFFFLIQADPAESHRDLSYRLYRLICLLFHLT